MTEFSNDQINTLPHRSPQLNELFTALAKAQAEMPVAGLNANNPYFKSKYANLAEVIKASRPALTKYGLAVLQQMSINLDNTSFLHTILSHSSGQWIESISAITPPKNDIQTRGSYITYLKRYDYAALIGVITGDEDDDGETAMQELRKNPQNFQEISPETITKEQLEELEFELNNLPELTNEILKKLNIPSLSNITKKQFLGTLNRIRDIKSLRATK